MVDGRSVQSTDAVHEFEKRFISRSQQCDGSLTKTACALGKARNTSRARLVEYTKSAPLSASSPPLGQLPATHI